MNKHLLSTSAIALGVAMAAPASAQQWDVSFGGFMSQHVGFADVDVDNAAGPVDLDGVDVHSATEIIFTPSVTLDNGLTFGVNVQLEGNTTGDTIDESYMEISGDHVGRIVIGSENSAGYLSMVAAPVVTSQWINSPSISQFIPFSGATGSAFPNVGRLQNGFRQALISSYTEVAGTGDLQRISYYTPDFNGLVVGVSYARDTSEDFGFNFSGAGFEENTNVVLGDIFDIGMNYSQTFGETSMTLSARYGTADNPTGADPDTWAIGAQFGFQSITIGGSYAENDNPGPADSTGFTLGVSYDAPGPWAFALSTVQGEGDDADVAAHGVVGAEEEYEAYKLGASRDLGPGVDWDIYLVHAEFSEDVGDGGGAGDDVEGTILGTAINLSF